MAALQPKSAGQCLSRKSRYAHNRNHHPHGIQYIGGTDIDYEDDGIIDDQPTPVEGRFHAVLTGQHMQTQDWTVTVLSVIANVKRSPVDYSPDDLIADIDLLAAFFLIDITGDGILDHQDAFAWDPQEHKYVNGFGEINESIHSGVTLISGYNAVNVLDAECWTHFRISAAEDGIKLYRAYNYTTRLAVDDGYAYFAAGKYGLLIYQLP